MCTSIAWAGVSITSASLSFHLLTKSHDSEREILVNNRGAVLNKSQIRGVLEVEKAGKLNIKFISSSGKEAKIVDNQEVSSNSSISLPSDKGWYELDDIPGHSKFQITLSTTAGEEQQMEFSFNQIPLSIGGDNYARNLTKSLIKEKPVSSNIKTVVPAKDAIPGWLDNSLKVSSKIKPEDTLNVRGKVGASLYKEFASSVILIVTNEGIGTGSIIDDKGTVLTNWHVIQGYETVGVILKPPLGKDIQERDVFKANVEKIDEVADLALLQIVSPPKGMMPIPLGTLEDIEIGADVHAIGHPTGESWSYTQGIISQVRGDYEWQTDDIGKHKATVVQTQTPINPGNSGGPLITDNKKLIGVNSFINPEAQGLNYAVSIKDVHEFVNSKQSRFFTKDESGGEPVSEILDYEEY